MRRAFVGSAAVLLLGFGSGTAGERGRAGLTYGARGAPGVSSVAAVIDVPTFLSGTEQAPRASGSTPSAERRPEYRYLPLTCVSTPEGNGDVVISLDQDACLMSSPDGDDVRRPDRLPSPYELAWLAADRAMSVAEWPQLEIAPGRLGLTGLRSYFWLQRAPASVTASASVPGLVVTAEAHPVRYTWSFGEGRSRATAHPGRAWSRRRSGDVSHMYERRGRYRVGVTVLWEARWRMGTSAWQHLGYFGNEDTRIYRVRQMVAMLTRAR